MSDNKYLRLTIDVCVFAEDSRSAARVASKLLSDGGGATSVPSEGAVKTIRILATDAHSENKGLTWVLLPNEDAAALATPDRAEGDGKTMVRRKLHPFGTGERMAREFMEQIVAGHIEIDDIRDVEDHTD